MGPTSSDLTGKTCVVTGATSGIGRVTARELARMGARVVLVCRSAEKGSEVVEEIRRETGRATDVVLADLASLAEVRRAAAEILAGCPRIDVLVNNAGIVNLRFERTADGLEATFAVNHLACFLLTNQLLERLRASAPARIVNVASEAHRLGRIDFDDLQHEKRYGWMKVYGASKLANVLFTYELARRLDGTGVTANCLHPGAVYTGLARNNGRLASFVYGLGRFLMKTPEQGAETSIHLASAPEVERVTGVYFENQKPRRSSAASQDPELARRLWQASERLTGLAGAA